MALHTPPYTDNDNSEENRVTAAWLNTVNVTVNTALGGAATPAAAVTALGFATSLGNYANDGLAAAGGVPVGGLYRNGSVLMLRIA